VLIAAWDAQSHRSGDLVDPELEVGFAQVYHCCGSSDGSVSAGIFDFANCRRVICTYAN
jgi:hypothetical protein